jgi:hypothetical protein
MECAQLSDRGKGGFWPQPEEEGVVLLKGRRHSDWRAVLAQPLGRIALWPSIVYCCPPTNGDQFEGKATPLPPRSTPPKFPLTESRIIE